jgi:hypothetical protein
LIRFKVFKSTCIMDNGCNIGINCKYPRARMLKKRTEFYLDI